jgi:phage anti-repressor protein
MSCTLDLDCTAGTIGGDVLLQRLKNAFSGSQQQLFVQSFWTTLQCDEEHDMVIDLDEACKYIDVVKGNAKRTLLKNFRESEHFQIFAYQIDKQKRGGHNAERIMMTPDTFKELCMLSNTSRAREVRTYYIKMEKVLKAYLKESAEQLHRQLMEKAASESRLLQENRRMLKEKAVVEAEKAEAEASLAAELEKQKQRAYVPVPQLDNVYVIKETSELHSDRHKIGKALNPKTRVATFNTGSARGVQELHRRATHNAPIVEDVVAVVMKKYHYQREHYMCSVEHSINVIDIVATVIDTLASCSDHITRADMLRTVRDNLEGVSGPDIVDGCEDFEYETYEELVKACLDFHSNSQDCVDCKHLTIAIQNFERNVSMLSDRFGDFEVLQRARMFAEVFAHKKRAQMFAHLIAENHTYDDVQRLEFHNKDGILKLCSKLPDQRKIILHICGKLGIKHTLDTDTRVSRRVIDDDIPGWTVLLEEARKAFGVRPPRVKCSAENPSCFRKITMDINVIMRMWSDVELRDAADGSRSRSEGWLRARIAPRAFAALFVDGN